MRPESRKLLWDEFDASRRIAEFVSGMSFEQYEGDARTSSAVERQLEILGEALNRLSRSDPDQAREIGELSRIVGLRNVLAHGYDGVDHRLVWSVIESKLPGLVGKLESLLSPETP